MLGWLGECCWVELSLKTHFSSPPHPLNPVPAAQTHTLSVAGVHLSAWQPGPGGPSLGDCYRGSGCRVRGCAPGEAGEKLSAGRGSRLRGGNQISQWERLSCWSQELSVELSLSLLNQGRTKSEPAPEQQDHCPLAGTAAFWVCHTGWCVIILELPFVCRPDWVTGPVSTEAWESDRFFFSSSFLFFCFHTKILHRAHKGPTYITGLI